MSYHERLVNQLAMQVELGFVPSVEVAPGAQPSSSPSERRITLPVETLPIEGDLRHAAAHEVIHLRRDDAPIQADPDASKGALAREASRWFLMELGVEQGVAEFFPGVDAIRHYDQPFPEGGRRAREAAWALNAAVLVMLGESPQPGARWVRRIADRVVRAAQTGQDAALVVALMRALTKEQLLELLRQTSRGRRREERTASASSEALSDSAQGGGDALEHGAGGDLVRWGPAPDRTDHAYRTLPSLGRLDLGRLHPDPPAVLRRARGGSLLGRPAQALAGRTLFQRSSEAHRTWIWIDASAFCIGASDVLWTAAQELRALLPASTVMAARRTHERDRIVLRFLENPQRRELARHCEGHSSLSVVLQRMVDGALRAPEHLVVLSGWNTPWDESARALAQRLVSRRGGRVSRVGSGCWTGRMRPLMALGELGLENSIRCLSEADHVA